jgi:PAS domain S-box-containing protein
METDETLPGQSMEELIALRQRVAALEVAVTWYQQAAGALHDSEIKFRTLVEGSLQGLLVHRNHRPLFVNQAFTAMFGYATPEDILRLETILPLIMPQDQARIMAYHDPFLRGEDMPVQYGFQGLRQDGTRLWVEGRATAVPWDGTPAILTTAFDMAAHYQVVAGLARYHLFSEQARDIVLFIRQNGQIIEANQAAVAAYGYDHETLLTMSIYDLRAPATSSLIAPQMMQADQSGILFETVHRRKDGSTFPVEVSSTGADIGGERLLLSIIRDITERKRIEEMRQQLAAIVESSDDAIIGKTLEGTITSWNRGAARLYGYTAAEAIGQPITLLGSPDVPDEIPRLLERLSRGEHIEHYETQRVCKDGTRIDVSLTISPIQDSTGRVIGASKIARDITARKRIEAALQASEAQFRALANALPTIVWTAAPDGTITFANDQWFHYCGLTPGQNTQDWPKLVLHPDDRDRCISQWTAVLARGTDYEIEVRNRRHDGVYRWFLTRAVPVRDPAGRITAWFGTTTDVHDRKLLEARLQQSEARLQLALTAASAAYWEWDQQTNTTTWSAEGYPLLGLVAGQATLSYEAWRQRVHPDDVARVEAAMAQAIAQRTELATEYRVVWPDGSLHWLQSRGQVVGNPEGGGPMRMLGLAVDITERKHAEQRLQQAHTVLEERVQERTTALTAANATLREEIAAREYAQAALVHREKLAAMGSLLASVAHELNNPLSVVMMQAEFLREEASNGSLAAHAMELNQAAARCVEIVQHFLSLARQQPPQYTRVALNAVVEAAMKLLAYPLQVDTITTESHLAEDLPILWADPHQLQQVVMNLVTNAHQALRETAGPRRLTLTTRQDPAQQRVILEVADTGHGISPAIRERIFEPFFTTKPPGVGTGLGLPLCLGIVKGHDGTISVDSEVGHGTVFRVELPVRPVPADMSAPEPVALPTAMRKTILIVDDEPGITRALAYLLRRDGHTVETAANGHLALKKCQGQDYTLILCDLRMPELDGPGFYRELQRCHPHLCPRVVFLTGDTLSPEAQAFLEHSGAPRLAKPFTAFMVRKAIQRL